MNGTGKLTLCRFYINNKMKYEPGDKILVLLTNEEGKVVDIMNESMVMIEIGRAHV